MIIVLVRMGCLFVSSVGRRLTVESLMTLRDGSRQFMWIGGFELCKIGGKQHHRSTFRAGSINVTGGEFGQQGISATLSIFDHARDSTQYTLRSYSPACVVAEIPY